MVSNGSGSQAKADCDEYDDLKSHQVLYELLLRLHHSTSYVDFLRFMTFREGTNVASLNVTSWDSYVAHTFRAEYVDEFIAETI